MGSTPEGRTNPLDELQIPEQSSIHREFFKEGELAKVLGGLLSRRSLPGSSTF